MKTEAETSAHAALDYLADLNPCFGLMMSLFEKDSRSKGFVVCGEPIRANKRHRAENKFKSNNESKMIVGLCVGLESDLYPSVCIEEDEEALATKKDIFSGLRMIRDSKSQLSRFEDSDQARNVTNYGLTWKK